MKTQIQAKTYFDNWRKVVYEEHDLLFTRKTNVPPPPPPPPPTNDTVPPLVSLPGIDDRVGSRPG